MKTGPSSPTTRLQPLPHLFGSPRWARSTASCPSRRGLRSTPRRAFPASGRATEWRDSPRGSTTGTAIFAGRTRRVGSRRGARLPRGHIRDAPERHPMHSESSGMPADHRRQVAVTLDSSPNFREYSPMGAWLFRNSQ